MCVGLSLDFIPGWNLLKVYLTGDLLQSLGRSSLQSQTHLDGWDFPVYCSTSLMILRPPRRSGVVIHLYSDNFFRSQWCFGTV